MDRAFVDRYGPRALVAGAAEGLGAAFAGALAARGLPLLLVDRDAAALQARAHELETSADVRGLAADLADPATLDRLAARDDLGLLVLNAAYVPVDPYLDRPIDDHLAAVELNVATALRLVHALAPPMVRRGRGGIVLLSSLAGLAGGPRLATYAGTKAFLLAFGRSLRRELRPAGVDVLVVAPGSVATPGLRRQATPAAYRRAMPPARVAEAALRALGRRGVVTPGHAATALLLRLLPYDWATALVERGSRQELA